MPPYINKSASNAEKKLFNLFSKTEVLQNWYCLHSLGLSSHVSKREGEIDFLLIGSKGVFVIEIKGGRVRRNNGSWFFTDRYGRITEKKESPFVQAKTSLYSLREVLIKKFGPSFKQYVYGYGLVFPDINFDISSPEWDPKIIFDNKDLDKPVNEYLIRLEKYWYSRQHSSLNINKKTVWNIVNYLRGDFETIIPVNIAIRESESEIVSFTNEQYGALDTMEENPRMIFSGPAGTGKTLLAMEKARRNNTNGVRTLFLCFNRLLGSHLALKAKREKLEKVTINSLHQFFYQNITASGLADKIRNNNAENLFTEIYPEYFLQSWSAAGKYDELIIDEGQDIITSKYIAALDHTIKGGFDKGKWSLFVDSESQKNIFQLFDYKVFSKLKNNSTFYKLTVNCRNTKPIALQAEIITGYPLGKIKKINGLPVRYLWYKNSSDQAHQVSTVINKLLKDGIEADEITILSPKRFMDSAAGSGRLRLDTHCYQLGKDKLSLQKGFVSCSSIQSYKGLENSIIFLTDIEGIESQENKSINYVGFTRPRSLLLVSINEKLKGEYKKCFAGVTRQGVK